MKRALTEKQIHNRLNKYYKEHFGERDTDGWYVNPAPNKWKFERNKRIIILVCDMQSGKITEE